MTLANSPRSIFAMTAHDELLRRAEEQARATIEARMESVRDLVAKEARVTELSEQIKQAEKEHRAAWQRATKQGWTPEELRRTGLTDPTTGRTRRRRSTPPTPVSKQPTAAHRDPSTPPPPQSPEH